MFMPVHLAPCIRTVPEHQKRIYACKLARLDARGLARAEVYNGNKTCTRGKYCVYNMYLKVPVRTTTVHVPYESSTGIGTRKWGRASGDAGGRGCLDAYCGSGGDKWEVALLTPVTIAASLTKVAVVTVMAPTTSYSTLDYEFVLVPTPSKCP